MNKLVTRAEAAIHKIDTFHNSDEVNRGDEVAEPRPHKVHVSLGKSVDTSVKFPLGDLEKREAEATGHQARLVTTEDKCSSMQNPHSNYRPQKFGNTHLKEGLMTAQKLAEKH